MFYTAKAWVLRPLSLPYSHAKVDSLTGLEMHDHNLPVKQVYSMACNIPTPDDLCLFCRVLDEEFKGVACPGSDGN